MQAPDIHLEFQTRETPVTIRTIRPEDREIEAAFVRNLSPESRYFRFHSGLRELTPEMLARFVDVDYPNNMALIATIDAGGTESQIGVARYAATPPGSDTAEVAIVVADAWQGSGIGTRLLLALRDVAHTVGIRNLRMHVLPQNRRMFELARRLGYEALPPEEGAGSRSLGKTIGRDGESESR